VEKLKEKGLYVETVDHEMTLRRCSRSKDIIEPLLKPQWYVNMKDMAAAAYNAVETGDVIINPKLSETEFKRWMQNIRDWCISRQLWWGHQAPVYYVKIEGESQSVHLVSGAPTLILSLTKESGGSQDAQRKRSMKRQKRNFPE